MTLLHRNKTAENTTAPINNGTTTQQAHGGLGQKLHNILHHGGNATTTPGLDAASTGLGTTYTTTAPIGTSYTTAPLGTTYTTTAPLSSGIQSSGLNSGPAPMIDSSLRSTNLPLHTQPGLSQQGPIFQSGLTQGGYSQGGLTQSGISQGFSQGGSPLLTQTGLSQGGFTQSGLSQGGFSQGGSPLLTQTGLYQGGSPLLTQTGLAQGGSPLLTQTSLSQGSSPLLTQTGLAQGGSPLLTQTGLQQPGLIQSINGQGFAGQNHLFLQPAGPTNLLPQQSVAPMHTAPGAHRGPALHTAAPIIGNQGLSHQPLLVNKKLRSTITDTALIQQQQLLQQQQQQQFIAAPVLQQQQQFVAAPVLQQREIIPTETHVRPTIVEQVERAERLVEVQPIIHREIEAPEVHVIEKHIYETVPSTGPSIINKPAIIEETVRPRIIEEVHPVVHREVPQPFIERVEQHISERVVQPTVMTKEIINDARPQFVPAGGFVAAGGPQAGPAPILAGGNIPPAPPMPTNNLSSSTLRR